MRTSKVIIAQGRVYRVLAFLNEERSWIVVSIVCVLLTCSLGENLGSLILQQIFSQAQAECRSSDKIGKVKAKNVGMRTSLLLMEKRSCKMIALDFSRKRSLVDEERGGEGERIWQSRREVGRFVGDGDLLARKLGANRTGFLI